jgi:hypothetical protein
LPHYIKSWNFTDEKNEALPVTRENLNFLQMDDVTFLVQQIQEFATESKKKLQNTQPSA